jgi:hypothetical protein
MSHDMQVSVEGHLVSEHFTVKNDATVWLMKLRITISLMNLRTPDWPSYARR